MLSFASKLVRSIEHSAETIIGGDDQSGSSLANDAYFSNASGLTFGFRILSVEDDSVSHQNGLQSWFDYIIGLNGHEIPTNYNEQYVLTPNYEHFINEISRNDKVELQVWSAKGGTVRTVQLPIEPLASSGLEDIPIESSPSLLQQHFFKSLGISLQWTPLITSTFVYHVLQIHPNSPAERAGLIEHSDYIIGAQDGLLATGGEDLLGRLIASKKNQPLEIYVYNQDFDIVRPVIIVPVDNWGGVGLLGAGVGYGILHRLPIPSYNEPGSILFDENESVADNFQPINNELLSNNVFTQPPPPPVHGRKKKATHSTNTDLLNYLETEGEKSRKLDTIQHKVENSDLPPPPRK